MSLPKGSEKYLSKSNVKTIKITDKNIEKYLGKPKYEFDMANTAPEIGIVRGLAWTSVGGDTLSIEVNVLSGKGKLELTGQLGDVMKESAMAGISYVRSMIPNMTLMRSILKSMIFIFIFRRGLCQRTVLLQVLRWQQR